VIPPGATLQYTPIASEQPAALPEDFAWAEPKAEPQRNQGVLELDTIEFDAVGGDETQAAPSSGPLDADASPDADEFASYGADPAAEIPEKGRGLLGRFGLKREKKESGEVRDWLGVDHDFDARKAGSEIGSWDKFSEDDDDAAGGLGWKGGWAGDDPIEDPEFASNEAARIRRRVTESVDRELSEKEVWFVATGAEEVGTCGMQALLHDFGDDLKDALIINIDGCGAGQLYWASAEGMARRYRASQRLVGLARRVSRESGTVIKPRVYKGLSTDATPALARGYKAISIMAFNSDGVPVNWHWKTDTVEEIDPALIEMTADFVAAMVREA
jgi:hypothetical protein